MDRLLAALAAMLGLATAVPVDHEKLRSEAAAAVAYAAALPAVSPAPAPAPSPGPDTGAVTPTAVKMAPARPRLGDVVEHPHHGGRYVFRSVCRNGVCEAPQWHWETYAPPPQRWRR